MWIATGVVVGLGVAGLVAASAGDGAPNKIIGGDTVVDDTSTATTSTLVDDQLETTTTTTEGPTTTTDGPTPTIRQIANVPTTAVALTTTTAPY